MNSPDYPKDAKERAKRILNGCGGQSIGNFYQNFHCFFQQDFNVEFNIYDPKTCQIFYQYSVASSLDLTLH